MNPDSYRKKNDDCASMVTATIEDAFPQPVDVTCDELEVTPKAAVGLIGTLYWVEEEVAEVVEPSMPALGEVVGGLEQSEKVHRTATIECRRIIQNARR